MSQGTLRSVARRIREKNSTAHGRAMGAPWSPFTPEKSPPPGYYDPALDAQARAGDRGLQQLLDDLATAGRRATDQYGVDTGAVQRQHDQGIEDLGRATSREGADFGLAGTRANEDNATSVANLLRGYQQQGRAQTSAASAAGLAGGFFAAAKAARDTNQSRDLTAQEQVHQRIMQDLASRHARFGEDAATQQGRLDQGLALQLDELKRGYDYGGADRTVQGQRATTENTFFGQDVNAQRFYQAGQQGYQAPAPPSNEHRDAQGKPYRINIEGGDAVAYNPDGTIRWRRPRAVQAR